MSRGVQHTVPSPSEPNRWGRTARRREHLRHIHPPTREQQLALIEEARAARLAHDQEQRSSQDR
jgi:hypothetical protein